MTSRSSLIGWNLLCSMFGALLLTASAQAQPLRDGAVIKTMETPFGTIQSVYRVDSAVRGGTPPSFNGDSYSFAHEIGALIDGLFQCFNVHMSGNDDNTVLFDGLSELLDPYVDGTQPTVFEFETPDPQNNTTNAFFNSFSGNGEDLFPEGFEDPDTGTPLDSACIEIGRDDLLQSDQPSVVTQALFEASDSNGTIIPQIDISGLFPNPFEGRLSVVFPGSAGAGINGMTLDLTVEPDQQPIFSDGFESGDATSWTDSTP